MNWSVSCRKPKMCSNQKWRAVLFQNTKSFWTSPDTIDSPSQCPGQNLIAHFLRGHKYGEGSPGFCYESVCVTVTWRLFFSLTLFSRLFTEHGGDGSGHVGSLHLYGRWLPADLPQQFARGDQQTFVLSVSTFDCDSCSHSEQETVIQTRSLHALTFYGLLTAVSLLEVSERHSWHPCDPQMIICSKNYVHKSRTVRQQLELQNIFNSPLQWICIFTSSGT